MTSIVREANDALKEITITSSSGEPDSFNILKEESNTPRILKQALAYEKIRKSWEAMNRKSQNITNEVMFDKTIDADLYDSLLSYYEKYAKQIGNLQKITRQVRKDANGELLESFSFIGDNGHITLGREGDVVASSQNLNSLEQFVDLLDE